MTSQSQPQTPVRVPKVATTYTPTTQDPDLRSQINTVLLRDGHVEKIQSALHHALHAHPTNWPSKVSHHALSLLRSGECTTFPKLLERVLEDIRRDTEEARLIPGPAPILPPNKGTSGSLALQKTGIGMSKNSVGKEGKGKNKVMVGQGAQAAVNGVGGGMVNGTGASAGSGNRSTGLAVPKTVIEEGVRITRECLELVCEIEE